MEIKESDIIRIIRRIIKEDVDNTVIITPNEYMDLLKRVNFQAQAIPKLPRFKGKKLVVNGDVNLSGNEKITDLGPIEIKGNLDVSRTSVRSLNQTETTGYVRIWGTPLEQIKKQQILNDRLAQQEQLRNNGEWDLDNPNISEIGEKAQAIFSYIKSQGYIDTLTDEDQEEIKRIRLEIQNLEEQQENLSVEDDNYSENFDEITDRQIELEDELSEIIGDKIDVYDLYLLGEHYHYGITSFLSLSTEFEFAAGTENEMDNALEVYFEDFIDRPEDHFSKEHLSSYIDENEVIEYFEDTIREWIIDEPSSYDVEVELSNSQEEEIWLLEMEKWVYENEGVRAPIKYPTKEKDGTFDFMDAENNNFQYKNDGRGWVLYKEGQIVSPRQLYDDEDTEEHDEEREGRISDIEYEIDEIKENPDGEPSDDAIDDAVYSYIQANIRGNALEFLTDLGGDYVNFINKKELQDDLLREGTYGDLSGYDGEYDSYTINGTNYNTIRI